MGAQILYVCVAFAFHIFFPGLVSSAICSFRLDSYSSTLQPRVYGLWKYWFAIVLPVDNPLDLAFAVKYSAFC